MTGLRYSSRTACRNRLAGTVDHQPVACPPNMAALCVCGDDLGDHISVHVDYAADGNARCPMMLDHTFQMVAGESLDCPNATDCDECDVAVCSEHSDNFTTCVDSVNVLHHVTCADRCPSCAATNYTSYEVDR